MMDQLLTMMESELEQGCSPALLDLVPGDMMFRTLLWLSSPEAFRIRTVCRELRSSLCAPGLLQIWEYFCSERRRTGNTQACNTRICGLHSSETVWLHSLLKEQEIASYMEKMGLCSILGELQFKDRWEVLALMDAMTALRVAGGCGNFFAASCVFNQNDLDLLFASLGDSAGSDPRVARSQPLCMSWRPNLRSSSEMRFHVRLKLAPVHGAVGAEASAACGVRLSLEASFRGDLFVEELDCIDLDIFGVCLAPNDSSTSQDATACHSPSLLSSGLADSKWHCHHVQPYMSVGSLGAATTTPSGDEDTILLKDPLFQLLRNGAPVVCALQVVLRTMGDEQTVQGHGLQFENSSPPETPKHEPVEHRQAPDEFVRQPSSGSDQVWQAPDSEHYSYEFLEHELEILLNSSRGGSGAQQGIAEADLA